MPPAAGAALRVNGSGASSAPSATVMPDSPGSRDTTFAGAVIDSLTPIAPGSTLKERQTGQGDALLPAQQAHVLGKTNSSCQE